ncbi:unnamed protein product [Blepharisma stoltei]|uniref:MPN domain-containing protein n=1 Tax=Blepharisma stoltei TaxID=1481888 RepID=A0AAU9IYV6_9CILI|nr:unnamed protein product [Blepharisma stoltei]
MDFQRIMQQQFNMRNQNLGDVPMVDTAEQIYISSLALLKMLKHGRAGVPLEVMGLLLGELVDEYTVRVVDVFAMPQSGTGVSVESIDEAFQINMTEMLKQTGRSEMVVGWYHSHPGFGCWLSGVDMNTQQSFEQQLARAVAVVIDPIQSVRGKVVIDAFRLINPQLSMRGMEPRQTTSNIGHVAKPSISALLHGLNRHYYSITINYRKNELEQSMLLNLQKQKWVQKLKVEDFMKREEENLKIIEEMVTLAETYNKWIQEEMKKTKQEMVVSTVGKLDPKKRLEHDVDQLMTNNILHSLSSMIDTVIF